MKTLGKFKTLAIASLSAIALAGSIAVAQSVKTDQGTDRGNGQRKHGDGQRGHGRGERGGREMGGGIFKQLNLTDDQKAKMKQIRESFAVANKPLREQLRAKRQELRQANEGGTFNEALATQKLTELAALQAKMMGAEFTLHQQMQSILTAEQKAQLEQAKAQFKTREGGRRQRGGEKRDNQ
jgi:Spy/CpxP family protein refolding chaperone